jgi:hypothetical protein
MISFITFTSNFSTLFSLFVIWLFGASDGGGGGDSDDGGADGGADGGNDGGDDAADDNTFLDGVASDDIASDEFTVALTIAPLPAITSSL